MRHAVAFFVLMLVAGFSNASISKHLTTDQEYVRLIAKAVGEENCIEDMCFIKTLQAIAWQESSFGKHIIGDVKKSYYYMHMDKQVFIPKSETYMSNGIRYYDFQPVEKVYVKKVYSSDKINLAESSLGPFQIQVPTARRVIKKMKLSNYYGLLSNETALIQHLLNDVRFGATIAVNYLIMNYTWAKGKYKSPWKLAVSRYNGGNINTKYTNAIIRKIRKL